MRPAETSDMDSSFVPSTAPPAACVIDVRAKINPIHWFLHGKDDVRSSYYLEDAATEFHVQGLELDWAGIVWDGDLRISRSGLNHFEFKGKKWNRVREIGASDISKERVPGSC